ncbi:MAG: fimbrillin family protein [Prevotella sp.]|nr:fimbrillin family protein [Prevotella sp.]
MRKIYFLAVAAAMFAACSSNDKLDTGQDPQQPVADAEVPVGFDAYTQRGTTRAGVPGTLTNADFKDDTKDLGKAGFGVFGYYTDNNDYDPQCIPNFMYNQQVKYTGGAWTYEPIKYWPNEYGTNAISDDADKVSFFAYAPYVEVIPSTGKVAGTAEDAKWGITGMSRNSASGDPLVKYIASFDEDKSVDLCWGTVGVTNTVWPVINTPSTDQTMTAGEPWLNVQRPSQINQNLTFDFKHALSQLTVDVDAYVDGTDATNALDAKTRIFIRSISFSGFAMKGALNLNNTEKDKALWLDYSGTADLDNGETVVVYDGRKDGKEGASGSEASNEKVLGLNPQFVQDENSIAAGTWAATGVNNVAASLFRKWNGTAYVASTEPVMVIPTGDDLELEIVYDVETLDPNLATYVSDSKTQGSSIENRIRKTVVFGNNGKMENGKRYVIHLHLGMNSVKLDANVEDWKDADSGAHVDLPLNVPAFAAAAAPFVAQTVNLLADQTKYEFAITGLDGGESVTAPVVAAPFSAPTSAAANSSGVAIESITIAANTSILNQAAVAYDWTGAASAKGVELSFVQLAHPLGLSVPTPAVGTSIQLASTAGNINTDGWLAAASDATPATISVKKNGMALTQQTTPTNANEFDINAGTGEITLGLAAVSGDVFEIKLKAGDAPAETITVAIP